MRIRRSTWGAVLMMLMTGCGSRQASAPPPPTAQPPAQTAQAPPQPPPQPRAEHMCPFMVDRATTHVSTIDTSDGVAIVFTTTSNVEDLRARVHHMADMHNQMVGMHGEMGGHHRGMHGMHGHPMGMRMVPSRATAEDIPGGARIVLVPNDPSQLSLLRQQAAMRAEMMQKGECPMMAPPAGTPEQQQPSGT